MLWESRITLSSTVGDSGTGLITTVRDSLAELKRKPAFTRNRFSRWDSHVTGGSQELPANKFTL
jgi:hypothetical protein